MWGSIHIINWVSINDFPYLFQHALPHSFLNYYAGVPLVPFCFMSVVAIHLPRRNLGNGCFSMEGPEFASKRRYNFSCSGSNRSARVLCALQEGIDCFSEEFRWFFFGSVEVPVLVLVLDEGSFKPANWFFKPKNCLMRHWSLSGSALTSSYDKIKICCLSKSSNYLIKCFA